MSVGNMYANHCMFIGRLTGDPELTQGDKTDRVNFTIAINSPHSRGTMYLRCVAWNETAHRIVRMCRKGYELMVQGEIDISIYQDKNHTDVKRTSVSLKVISFSSGSRPIHEKGVIKLPDLSL